MASLLVLLGNPLLPREGASTEISKRIGLVADVLSGTRDQVSARNQRFVAKESVRYKAFFDSVERPPP